MTAIAPRWAFNAQAIHGLGDAHLTAGVHLRILPSKILGLPAAPFAVYRIRLGAGAKDAGLHTDIEWIDARGNPRVPPFDVAADNPVTGWLPRPADGVCCWIQVDATPGSILSTAPPRTLGETAGLRTSAADALLQTSLSPSAARAIGAVRPRGGLSVEAVVTTPRGDGVIGRAVRAPYQLAASRIERVVVAGTGRVTGAQWVDARPLFKSQDIWSFLSLPVASGPRYGSVPNAPALALDRVKRGAPLRLTPMDAPDAASAAACPISTPEAELTRVADLATDVQPWLAALLTDTSAPPHALLRAELIADVIGDRRTARFDLLGSLLQASLDPGVARWLGFGDVDEAPPTTTTGQVIAYIVRGLWSIDQQRLGQLFPMLPSEAFTDPSLLLGRLLPGSRISGGPSGPFLDLVAVACATMGNAPARPAPPRLAAPVPGTWQPVGESVSPSEAPRLIDVPMDALVPAAALAVGRRAGPAIAGLNPRRPTGRARPVAPSPPRAAALTGQAVYVDRTAPAATVGYRLAQSDWFGRWSDWAERSAAPIPRPKPPRPAVKATFVPPGVLPNGNLTSAAGTIEVRVPVPPPSGLAPGSLPLATLEVQAGATAASASAAAGADAELLVSVTAPVLARAQTLTLSVIARWVDSAGIRSADSDAVALLLADPRPPLTTPTVVPIAYAARPDASSKARVQITWTIESQDAAYRVFYADETQFRARLQQAGAPGTAVLAALDAAPNAEARALVYSTNQLTFTRDMFQQLTPRPLVRAGATGQPMTFTHAVSGSLRVLSFYRVVPMSAANVEAPFTAVALRPVAVPSTRTPTAPMLTVSITPDGGGQPRATASIKVPRGTAVAAEYRLRRASTVAADALAMPSVATGAVPASTDGGPQRIDVVDLGASEIAPSGRLGAWTTYSWRAEVRAGPDPGGPPARWSRPSAVAQAAFIPAAPPTPAAGLTAERQGADVLLRWEHPEPLLGGSMGGYRFDVFRQTPGQRPMQAGFLPADADVSAGGRTPDRTGEFRFIDTAASTGELPDGTVYRIVTVDPIGRASVPSVVTLS